MSNLIQFKDKLTKLSHTISGTQSDCADDGKTTSTFYTKLIQLIDALNKDSTLKNCKYIFGNTSADASNKTYSIIISSKDQNCISNLEKSSILTQHGIKFDKKNNQSYLSYTKTSLENPSLIGNENYLEREKRKQEIAGKLYEPLNPLYNQLSSQGDEVQSNLQKMAEDIKKIKKIMYG